MSDAVLVIGADGFVGCRLVPFLTSAGYTVLAHRRHDGPLAGAQGTHRLSHVINVAGRTFVPASWENPLPFYADNVMTTVEALQACRNAGAALIHVSSYVYGRPRALPIREDHPLEACNPYAHSKIVAESVVDFHRRHMNVRATVIRPFNLYGPGQPARFLSPSILAQFLDPSCQSVEVTDLRPRRDYLHVDDLLDLVGRVIASRCAGIFNAGSGVSLSVDDLVRRVGEAVGIAKEVVETGPRRQNEILDVVADISAAREQLGWQPAIELTQGLRRLVTDRQGGRTA